MTAAFFSTDQPSPEDICQEAIDAAISTMHDMAGNPGQEELCSRYEGPVEDMGESLVDEPPDLESLTSACAAEAGERAESAIAGTSQIIQAAFNILDQYYPLVQAAEAAAEAEQVQDDILQAILDKRQEAWQDLQNLQDAADEFEGLGGEMIDGEAVLEDGALFEGEGGLGEEFGSGALEGGGIDWGVVEGVAIDVAEFG